MVASRERSTVMTATDAARRRFDDRTAGDGDRDALELLTDDGEEWTAVPETAADRERLTRWITVDSDCLRDLEEWR